MCVLVSGWFSFENMGATAGDLIACDVLCNWLTSAGISYEIAYAPPFDGGVRWQHTDPGKYTHIIFVCGPFGNGWPVTEFLEHFKGVKLVGLNLTLLESLEQWNPFEFCYERDSASSHRPDITFASCSERIPVVGVILAHLQKEYGSRSKHAEANEAIQNLVSSRHIVRIDIDTSLENNAGGLKTPEEIESLIAKMDIVVTTRLHGLALSIKNGVPVVALDPIEGGDKITRQARSIGWPVVFSPGQYSPEKIEEAFQFCTTNEAKALALKCAETAREKVEAMGKELMDKLNHV